MFKFGSSCSLSYQGLSIKYDRPSGIVCLTDLWRAQCSPASQRPLAWIRLLATQKLLKRLAWAANVDPLWSKRQQPRQQSEQLIMAIPGILETFKDESDLLTYAKTNLAVVYAHYLAPECYEWARANFATETALVEEWLAQQSLLESQKQHKTFTRRAVVAAGWSIPIVSAVALNQRAAAQVSAGRSRTGTTNTRTTNTRTTNTGINNTTRTTNTGTTNTGINNTTGTTNTTRTTNTGTTNTGLNNTTGTTNTGLNNTTGTTNTGLNNTTGTTNTGLNNAGINNTGVNNTNGLNNAGINNTGINNTGINNTGTTTGIGTTTTGTTTGIGTTTTGTTTTGTTTTGTGL